MLGCKCSRAGLAASGPVLMMSTPRCRTHTPGDTASAAGALALEGVPDLARQVETLTLQLTDEFAEKESLRRQLADSQRTREDHESRSSRATNEQRNVSVSKRG